MIDTFWKASLLAAFSLAGFTNCAQADPERDPDTLALLFQKLKGSYSCKGESARGYATAANISITGEYGDRVLTYRHNGTAGNTNQMIAIWSYDKPNQTLVAARHFVTEGGNFGDVYAGDRWDENSLTLSARALWQPLWKENRFLYEITSETSFKVTWQVMKDDDWTMGDYLVCIRS